MENEVESLDELIKQSPLILKLLAEIDQLWKNRKNKDYFTARESKELDLKILDLLEECAQELLKIKDIEKRNKLASIVYIMRYDFYLNDEIVLSEPIDEVFDKFGRESVEKILIEIELARKRLSEFYVGFKD